MSTKSPKLVTIGIGDKDFNRGLEILNLEKGSIEMLANITNSLNREIMFSYTLPLINNSILTNKFVFLSQNYIHSEFVPIILKKPANDTNLISKIRWFPSNSSKNTETKFLLNKEELVKSLLQIIRINNNERDILLRINHFQSRRKYLTNVINSICESYIVFFEFIKNRLDPGVITGQKNEEVIIDIVNHFLLAFFWKGSKDYEREKVVSTFFLNKAKMSIGSILEKNFDEYIKILYCEKLLRRKLKNFLERLLNWLSNNVMEKKYIFHFTLLDSKVINEKELETIKKSDGPNKFIFILCEPIEKYDNDLIKPFTPGGKIDEILFKLLVDLEIVKTKDRIDNWFINTSNGFSLVEKIESIQELSLDLFSKIIFTIIYETGVKNKKGLLISKDSKKLDAGTINKIVKQTTDRMILVNPKL